MYYTVTNINKIYYLNHKCKKWSNLLTKTFSTRSLNRAEFQMCNHTADSFTPLIKLLVSMPTTWFCPTQSSIGVVPVASHLVSQCHTYFYHGGVLGNDPE